MSVQKIKKMMKNFKSSIEDEKYLCSLNRLNGEDLIKLEKLKQVELGLANSNDDYRLQHDVEKQLIIIDTVLQARALSN
tara:strand:+ start:102 stop:338 length:237 start_codon:yes stop_codon:yes gene_type:complete